MDVNHFGLTFSPTAHEHLVRILWEKVSSHEKCKVITYCNPFLTEVKKKKKLPVFGYDLK